MGEKLKLKFKPWIAQVILLVHRKLKKACYMTNSSLSGLGQIQQHLICQRQPNNITFIFRR